MRKFRTESEFERSRLLVNQHDSFTGGVPMAGGCAFKVGGNCGAWTESAEGITCECGSGGCSSTDCFALKQAFLRLSAHDRNNMKGYTIKCGTTPNNGCGERVGNTIYIDKTAIAGTECWSLSISNVFLHEVAHALGVSSVLYPPPLNEQTCNKYSDHHLPYTPISLLKLSSVLPEGGGPLWSDDPSIGSPPLSDVRY